MAKWICKVCGYTHYGDEVPETCPQCGAMKSMFYKERKNNGCIWYMLAFFILLIGSCFFIMSCPSASTVDNSTIQSLDVNRFMGRWYEIARYDHKFERDMQQVSTIYAIKKNGKIQIINQGLKKEKWKTSEGKGKLTKTPGLLRVSFWGPFYSDYRILMIDPEYSYALIGGENDKYLWILSRSPQISPDICKKILTEAQRRGYNTTQLIWVEQKD